MDPYVYNAIAPDHLLGGKSKFPKEFGFLYGQEPEKIRSTNVMLYVYMRNLGRVSQPVLLNEKKKALNHMSISAIIGLITFKACFHEGTSS